MHNFAERLCGAGRGEDCHRYSGEIPIDLIRTGYAKKYNGRLSFIITVSHFPFKESGDFYRNK